MNPPNPPTAAASEGVARPNTIEPSTARIISASGKNDVSSILKISSRSQFHSRYVTATMATPPANTNHSQDGIGSRSGPSLDSGFAASFVVAPGAVFGPLAPA